jgi:hypothetical protein
MKEQRFYSNLFSAYKLCKASVLWNLFLATTDSVFHVPILYAKTEAASANLTMIFTGQTARSYNTQLHRQT